MLTTHWRLTAWTLVAMSTVAWLFVFYMGVQIDRRFDLLSQHIDRATLLIQENIRKLSVELSDQTR